MRQDRRILGYLAIIVSLLCCLPGAGVSGLLVFWATTISVDPSYPWKMDDTVMFAGFGIVLALSVLAGVALVALGVWSILSAPKAPVE